MGAERTVQLLARQGSLEEYELEVLSLMVELHCCLFKGLSFAAATSWSGFN